MIALLRRPDVVPSLFSPGLEAGEAGAAQVPLPQRIGDLVLGRLRAGRCRPLGDGLRWSEPKIARFGAFALACAAVPLVKATLLALARV